MGCLARRFSFVWFFCLFGVMAMAVGCSEGPPMGDVTGTVTINGVPANTGSISFFPVDGKSVTTGTKIEGGKYSAQVPVGKVKVEIRVSKVVGRKKLYDTPNSPVQEILHEVLPPKYNDRTEIELDVQPGENQKNYDLKVG